MNQALYAHMNNKRKKKKERPRHELKASLGYLVRPYLQMNKQKQKNIQKGFQHIHICFTSHRYTESSKYFSTKESVKIRYDWPKLFRK
jgi:hypothetical protein